MKDKINTIFRLRGKIGTFHLKLGAIRHMHYVPLPVLFTLCWVLGGKGRMEGF